MLVARHQLGAVNAAWFPRAYKYIITKPQLTEKRFISCRFMVEYSISRRKCIRPLYLTSFNHLVSTSKSRVPFVKIIFPVSLMSAFKIHFLYAVWHFAILFSFPIMFVWVNIKLVTAARFCEPAVNVKILQQLTRV